MFSTTTVITFPTMTGNAKPARNAANQEPIDMDELVSLMGRLSLSDEITTDPQDQPQVSVATIVNSNEKSDKSNQTDDVSTKVATNESSNATDASLAAILTEGDKIEAEMNQTTADLFGIPCLLLDNANLSSDSQKSQPSYISNDNSSLETTSKADPQLESSIAQMTRRFRHLSIVCHAMDEDQDEMELDMFEHDDVHMEPYQEEHDDMELDDPEEMDWTYLNC